MYFGRIMYKTKTLVKFVDNRKSCCALFLLWSRIMFEPFSSYHKAILTGSSFCTFGRVMYKTKTLVKFVDNRKSCCSLFLLRSRIMFEPLSSDFKTILTGSSSLGLRSSVFVLYPSALLDMKTRNRLTRIDTMLKENCR